MNTGIDESTKAQALRDILEMEQKKGRNHPLDEFRSWLKEADLLPEETPLKIHAAGTNGKGSVCSWLALMAKEKGLHTGLFTSPHLIMHTERIQVDGTPIPLEDWERIYDKYRQVFEEKRMTMFEIDLWMSLAYFKGKRPDALIIETGLGGTRDATTALEYDLTLITNIGMDHMAYLGSTIEEIAMAKAGILLPDVPAVLGLMDPAASRVIEEEAKKRNAPCSTILPEDIALLEQNGALMDSFKAARLPDYQKQNFLLALKGMERLGFHFEEEELAGIIRRFSWKGRFEILQTDPLIAVDGAHNLHGMRALCDSIRPGEFEACFFSVLADKQAGAMIEELRKKIPDITLVHFDTPRLADLSALAEMENLPVYTYEQMLERLARTRKSTLICGSLYFVGDVLRDFPKTEIPTDK